MHKALLIFVCFGGIIFADEPVIIVPGLGEQPIAEAKKTKTPNNEPNQTQGGTQQSPVFVKVIGREDSAQDAKEHAEDRAERFKADKDTFAFAQTATRANVAYVCIAGLQLLVLGIQCYQLSKTLQSGKEQGVALSDMVNEAKRSADSIREGAANIRLAADAVRDNATMAKGMLSKQMRAYLHVDTGHALFQEAQKEIRFQGRPLLSNNGFTSARNVRVRIRAEIKPAIPPDNEVFREPFGFEGTWYLGPRQSMSMPVSVEALVADEEIADIKIGRNKILFVWGVVTYDDINEGHQTLTFCLNYQWLNDGSLLGTFIGGRCDST